MPTYEYGCENCGELFEEFQSITAETVADCPKCGKIAKRKFSVGGGIIFRGSGFYVNDYKNKKPSCENSSPKSPACASCPSSNS